jgi:hypothetical protein
MASDDSQKERVESEYEHESGDVDVASDEAGRMSTLGCMRYTERYTA